MTTEQEDILGHRLDRHGRVLAGPGTGKSTTVVRLAQRIANENPGQPARVTTFTRAATAELVEKAAEEEADVVEPTTLHSFSMSILMRNPGLAGLPEPVRIPDEWEIRQLIRPDIRTRLNERDFDVDVRVVERLEREMAAQWESLNPDLVLLADLDPQLRNAYLGVWQSHRELFGYSLFAEMPLYAGQLVVDHSDLNLPDFSLLIVDEFQDLNMAEIRLVEALATRGKTILAVGDDDQSIYSFRMADPRGIRDLDAVLPDLIDYPLTVSFRCGRRILDAAATLIESTPGRGPKQRVVPGESNPEGEFEYLSFRTANTERQGVVDLIRHLIDTENIPPAEIAVLMRSDYASVWSDPLRQDLIRAGIPATDVEAALDPLYEEDARRLLSIARLAASPEDSLAWWGLLRLTRGVSYRFIRLCADEAEANSERFATRVLRLPDEAVMGGSRQASRAATEVVREVVRILSEVNVEGALPSEEGWATWLLETANRIGIDLPDELRNLLTEVGRQTPQEEGLNHYLNQLEPVAKDLATQTEGVSIMTMTRSKGLTFQAAITMGVEQGVIPSPRAKDENEERRLLYVAMTRARRFCYLTMATRRTGPTARTGQPNVGATRSRSSFFRVLDIAPRDGRDYVQNL
jgi:DNA helicase-2/ATP-dependent DNA helicase PcrA